MDMWNISHLLIFFPFSLSIWAILFHSHLSWPYQPAVASLLIPTVQSTLCHVFCLLTWIVISNLYYSIYLCAYVLAPQLDCILFERDSSILFGVEEFCFETVLPGFKSRFHHFWILCLWASNWCLKSMGIYSDQSGSIKNAHRWGICLIRIRKVSYCENRLERWLLWKEGYYLGPLKESQNPSCYIISSSQIKCLAILIF